MQWLICAIAAIGFVFDIYVLLMLPLIIKPALGRGWERRRTQRRAPFVPGSPEYTELGTHAFLRPHCRGRVSACWAVI